MFGLKDQEIEVIVKALQNHPDVEEALIFGSRAMGNYKPGSDVDIALKGRLTPETAAEIAIELNQRLPLPYKFDVIDYSTISHKPLALHIDSYGKTIYRKRS